MGRRRGTRPKHTLLEQLEELGRRNPEMLAWLTVAAQLRQARPGATMVLINPQGIAPTLPQGEILKRMKAAKAGKPIAFEVDYRDGQPPTTVMLPLTLTPSGPAAPPRKGGRPAKLTPDQFRDHCRDHPGLSNRQRAKMLNVSRTLIGTLHQRLGRRKRSWPKK